MPPSTGAREAASARFTVRSVGVRCSPGGRLRPVVTALRELLTDEDDQSEALPGFTVHGMEVGEWLARQRQHAVWVELMEEQRELLEAAAPGAAGARQGSHEGCERLREGRGGKPARGR